MQMEKTRGAAKLIDLDKTTELLEPEETNAGGLFVPKKDRPMFRAPELKTPLGLNGRVNEKLGVSSIDGGFKIPRVAPVAALMDDEDKSESSGIDEVGSNITNGVRSHASRLYRETSASEISDAENTLNVGPAGDTSVTHRSSEHTAVDVSASTGSSQSSRYDRDDSGSERKDMKDDPRSESRGTSKRDNYDSKGRYHGRDHGREVRGRYEPEYGGEYGRKRRRYEGTRRTPDM